MRVIGIDPGYDRLGVAIMEHQERGAERLLYSTCIQTNREQPLTIRLREVGDAFLGLLTDYEPTALGIETLFFNKNQKTALGVAQVRGVLMYLAQTHHCAVYEFGPQEIKIAVTGYGKSDKAAVIAMVKRLVPTAPESALDDEYDAIAVGITCLAHHHRTK